MCSFNLEWKFFNNAKRLSESCVWGWKWVELELQRQGRLGHLVPSLLNVRMKVLDICLRLPHNHTINVLIRNVRVAHIDL